MNQDSSTQFQILISGCDPQKNLDEIVQAFARMTNSDVDKAKYFISHGPRPLPGKYSQHKATSILNRLKGMGILCSIVPVQSTAKPPLETSKFESSAETKPESQISKAEPTPTKGLSLEPMGEESAPPPFVGREQSSEPAISLCPKCGKSQPKSDECIYCGILFSKYYAKKQNEKNPIKSSSIISEETRSNLMDHARGALADMVHGKIKMVLIVIAIASPLLLFGKGFSISSLIFSSDDEIHYYTSADPMGCVEISKITNAYHARGNIKGKFSDHIRTNRELMSKMVVLRNQHFQAKGEEKERLAKQIEETEQEIKQLVQDVNQTNRDQDKFYNSSDSKFIESYIQKVGPAVLQNIISRYENENKICRVNYVLAVGNTGTAAQENVHIHLAKDIVADLTNNNAEDINQSLSASHGLLKASDTNVTNAQFSTTNDTNNITIQISQFQPNQLVKVEFTGWVKENSEVPDWNNLLKEVKPSKGSAHESDPQTLTFARMVGDFL